VRHGFVAVPVGMRTRLWTSVLVMFVVDMLVLMLHGLVRVLMVMPLGQM
jgi:hypothetical protein